MFPVCCMQSGRSDGDGVEEMIKVIKKKASTKKKKEHTLQLKSTHYSRH